MTIEVFSREVNSLLSVAPTQHFLSQVRMAEMLFNSKLSPILLFGAGGLGRKTLIGLRSQGVVVRAFIDNNPLLAGELIDGVPVLSVAEAVSAYGSNGVVVITIWRGPTTETMQDRIQAVKSAGFKKILPFYYLFWQRRGIFLPHYSVQHPDEVRRQATSVQKAAALFKDERSQREFLEQLHWRIDPEARALETVDVESIYFSQNLYQFSSDEVYVDCGGFDGDTLNDFRRATKGKFAKAFVFEPDPSNFIKLNSMVNSLRDEERSRIRTFPCALGSARGEITFDAAGGVISQISASGAIQVKCEPLDYILANEQVTFIKMDIEGAEMDAILGGAELIKRSRPILAICLYHTQDHLWSIPLIIASFVSNYEFYLRTHDKDGTDLVLYAVPRERRKLEGLNL